MSTATTAARKKPAGNRVTRWWRSLTPRGKALLALLVASPFLLFVVLVGVVYARTDIPLPGELDTAQATIIEYSDGTTMGQIAKENRTDISLKDVPPHVRDAVLAAEDRSYYSHSGISLTGIARAAYQDVRGGGARQGGSTITQQYARNAFLNRDRTFARKFREAIVAVKLDRKYSKDQVLEWYLNTIYFGRGAYGVEAAAQTFFGVPAKRLTVEQGALLAALIRSPEGGDPAINQDVAERRWKGVLDGMVETGTLDRARADSARFPRVRPRKAVAGKKEAGGNGPTGFVIEAVRQELKANGFTDDQILTGGLRVRTTIDKRRQEAAVKAVTDVLDDPRKDPPAALVAIEPGTGKVVAMYGGRDYGGSGDKAFFNYATQNRRQAGSSFKPFVLAAAIDEGISIRSRYDGRSPQTFANYPVRNFDDEQFGQIDLIQATAHSVNTIYVPLGMEVGFEKTMDMVHRLGVSEKVTCEANRDATLYLGTCDLAPIDEATAFATFANNGEAAKWHLVTQVNRKGRKVYAAKISKSEAMSEGEAADAIHAMRAVIDDGTARRARIGRPAAGKTGTTSDNTDAWFSGFVPQLSATVWMGYEPRADESGKARIPPLQDVQGFNEVTGGSLPAMIWNAFMTAALEGVPVEEFPPPVFGGKAVNGSASPSPSSGSPTPSVTPTVTVSVTVAPTTQGPEPTLVPTSSPTKDPKPSESPSESPAPSADSSQQPPPEGGGEGGSEGGG